MPTKLDNGIYSESAKRVLAPYASIPENSRGRLNKEHERNKGSVYQRDRDRIIHCVAFRRLEYKTQVFVYNEGDHYRTRLTHSLEVAQLARSMARELSLDEDLAEAISLAHDLGHTPFGHAGEDALHGAMKRYGGFDHNAHTLRIVTKLESKYSEFDGLNLTWECLEGLAKHNGSLLRKGGLLSALSSGNIPRAIKKYNSKHDLELHTNPSLEAQLASLCDDIAYNNHDIEDGIRAGLFNPEDIYDVPMMGQLFQDIIKAKPDIEKSRLIHEVKRKSISMMAIDLVEQTEKNIKEYKIQNIDDVRNHKRFIVSHSPEMKKNNQAIKKFLQDNMYSHYRVNRMTSKARRVVSDLFRYFFAEPNCLPKEWYEKTKSKSQEAIAIIISDYIAGMTDRYAIQEHRKIFDTAYKLIED